MNQVKTEPGSPVYQETGHSQSTVGFPQGGLVDFLLEGAQNLASMTTTSTQTPQPPPRSLVYNKKVKEEPKNGQTFPVREKSLKEGAGSRDSMAVTGEETETGNSGGSTSSSLPQEGAGASARSSLKPPDTLSKRERRLMNNREAARECRRKKKEFYERLENHVAMLENQNKKLIEELRALKDIDRHKAE